MAVNTYLSIIVLNKNRCKALIKRYRVADCTENKNLQYSATRDPL